MDGKSSKSCEAAESKLCYVSFEFGDWVRAIIFLRINYQETSIICYAQKTSIQGSMETASNKLSLNQMESSGITTMKTFIRLK